MFVEWLGDVTTDMQGTNTNTIWLIIPMTDHAMKDIFLSNASYLGTQAAVALAEDLDPAVPDGLRRLGVRHPGAQSLQEDALPASQ